MLCILFFGFIQFSFFLLYLLCSTFWLVVSFYWINVKNVSKVWAWQQSSIKAIEMVGETILPILSLNPSSPLDTAADKRVNFCCSLNHSHYEYGLDTHDVHAMRRAFLSRKICSIKRELKLPWSMLMWLEQKRELNIRTWFFEFNAAEFTESCCHCVVWYSIHYWNLSFRPNYMQIQLHITKKKTKLVNVDNNSKSQNVIMIWNKSRISWLSCAVIEISPP